MSESTYREKISSGGELVACGDSVRIEYFFAGPDTRYGGVHFTIRGDEIEAYMRAWKNNYDRYTVMRSENGRRMCAEKGEYGMMIRSGYMGGVYLTGNHMRVSTEAQLAAVLADYERCLSFVHARE